MNSAQGALLFTCRQASPESGRERTEQRPMNEARERNDRGANLLGWRGIVFLVLAATLIAGALLASRPDGGPLGSVAAARASSTVPAYNDCDAGEVVHPFASWGDDRDYMAIPNGSFEEGLTGWSVTGSGDATIVPVLNPDGSVGQALQIGKGTKVISPPICFDETRPHSRMYTRKVVPAPSIERSLASKGSDDGKSDDGKSDDGKSDDGKPGDGKPGDGSDNSSLRVNVKYLRDSKGKPAHIKAGTFGRDQLPGLVWQPSPFLGTGLTGLKKSMMADENGHRWYRLEIKVQGNGAWQIDDLFVDPRARH
jgi:hypothetical protein